MSLSSSRVRALVLLAVCAALGLGCASTANHRVDAAPSFDFESDVFAFANQLYWEYSFDEETGKQVARSREEEVEFGQRCMVMTRGARQFHRAARFEPAAARVNEEQYRQLVARVFATSTRRLEPSEPISIPGYANLKELSADLESLVKSEVPGRWRAYFQRGDWRMIFPFFDEHQRRIAREFVEALDAKRLPIARLIRFPRITVNHAVLVYAAEEDAAEIHFTAYDPNYPEAPFRFVFDRGSASFSVPARSYYLGGYVKVYQAYDGWIF